MTFTVDVHHHLIPDFYRRATEHDGQSVGGVRPAVWTLLPRLAAYAPADMGRTDGTENGHSK
jgi:hypothetical protein